MQPQHVVFLSDIHIPYQDPLAWALSLEAVRRLKPHGIFLGGDIMDFYPVSPFDKDPQRVLSLDEDVYETYKALYALREAAGSGAWFRWLPGNHEAWLRQNGWRRWKALARGLDIPALFRFYDWSLANLEITMLPEGKLDSLGELHFAHGHEFGIRSSNHPARATLQRVPGNILFGHWHVSDVAEMRLLNGKVYRAWANPCLSTLEPEYVLRPQWMQGVTRIDFTKSGAFHADTVNFFNREGKLACVLDGELIVCNNDTKKRGRQKVA